MGQWLWESLAAPQTVTQSYRVTRQFHSEVHTQQK